MRVVARAAELLWHDRDGWERLMVVTTAAEFVLLTLWLTVWRG